MSARIAPEPISIGITLATETQSRVDRSTRAIEPASTPADNKQGSTLGRNSEPPQQSQSSQTSLRPPGQDPSALPQTLFDAALIASENKPSFEIIKKEAPEAAEPDDSDDESNSAIGTPKNSNEKQNVQIKGQMKSAQQLTEQSNATLENHDTTAANYESNSDQYA